MPAINYHENGGLKLSQQNNPQDHSDENIIADYKRGFVIRELVVKHGKSRSSIGRIVKGIRRENGKNKGENINNREITMPGENPEISNLAREIPHENLEIPKETDQQRQQREYITEMITESLVDGHDYPEVSRAFNVPEEDLRKYFPPESILHLRREEQKVFESRDPASMVPSQHLIVPLEMIDDLEKDVPKTQQRGVRRWRRDLIRYNRILDAERKKTSPGVPSSSYRSGSGYDELCREAAETIKIQRVLMLREGFGGRPKNDGISTIVDAIKLGISMNPQQKTDTIGIWKDGYKESKNLSGGSGTANQFSLKLEEMRELHDVDMEKLRWEQKKYFLEMERDSNKWENLGKMFNPIFQDPRIQEQTKKIMHGVGERLANSVLNVGNPDGHGSAEAETLKLTCPGCKTQLEIPKQSIGPGLKVKCASCGELFDAVPKEEKTSAVSKLKAHYR